MLLACGSRPDAWKVNPVSQSEQRVTARLEVDIACVHHLTDSRFDYEQALGELESRFLFICKTVQVEKANN